MAFISPQSPQNGYRAMLGTRAPIYCLDLCPASGYLAIGLGSEVHVTKKITTCQYHFRTAVILYCTDVLFPSSTLRHILHFARTTQPP